MAAPVPLMLGTGCIACVLWAARWNDVAASASALRWATGVYLLLASAPLWTLRDSPSRRQRYGGMPRTARTLVFSLTSVPILLLSVYPAGLTLSGARVVGPLSTSFFAAAGNAVSYSVPLLLVAVACIGNATSERSPGWAFLGSLVFNFTTTLGYALAVTTAGHRFDAVYLIRLAQLNTITLAAFALVWQSARCLREHKTVPTAPAPGWMCAQVVAALAGNILLIAPAAVSLAGAPTRGAAELAVVGDPFGWIVFLMTLGAALWINGARIAEISLGAVTGGLVALSAMAALAAVRWDSGDWLAFHVLMIGLCLSGAALLAIAFRFDRSRTGCAAPGVASGAPVDETSSAIPLQYYRRDQSLGPPSAGIIDLGARELHSAVLRCLAVITTIMVLLALRAMAGDPQRPWWSAAGCVILSLLWIAAAWGSLVPRLLYAGGVLLNLAGTLWYVDQPWAKSAAPTLDLISANIVVLAFSGLAAMVLEVQVFRGKIAKSARLPFHRFAAIVSTAVVTAVAGLTICRDALGVPPHASVLMNWAAVGTSVMLVAATLVWDIEVQLAAGALYALGLVVVIVALDSLNLPVNRMGWAAAICVSGYVLLTGAIAAFNDVLRGFFERLGGRRSVPEDGRYTGFGWLAAANLVLSATVIILSLWVDFTFAHRGMRLAAASAAVVQVLGLGLGARWDHRLDARQATLWVGALAATAWGWAWMDPALAIPLNRSVAAAAALAVTIALMGSFVARVLRRESPWSIAIRSTLVPMVGTWGAVLLVILGTEIVTRVSGGAIIMHPVAIGTVMAALVGGALACLWMALNPARDPLQLRPARRGAYVYAAEGLLACAFLHLRLTMPQLFGGAMAQYWPMLVMGLAFLGVGLGEIFRRGRVPVLSDPLFRTGVFLPILPAIAYWVLPPSRVGYGYLLFTAGFFYAVLSATRKSFWLGVLAALAANGGFWWMLARSPQLGFVVHPQLWLIPAAVSVLIAAQLNARRLSLSQLRAVRYACLIAVYVSSTADVFLNGVSRAPWLPVVLAALSVAGVMVGILFRVRGFLVLGTSFLTLSIVTMIYYASTNLGWTWLWYVSGIILGCGIIATFALFEKKRTEMVALVEGLKQWQ